MKIKVKDKDVRNVVGCYIMDDDIILLPNYKIYKLKQYLQTFGLFLLFAVLLLIMFYFTKLPKEIHVEPIDRIYAIGDNSVEHYQVTVTSILNQNYVTRCATVDVCFGLNDQLDVRASLFGLFYDAIRVIPIAQESIGGEYTKKVYEGDVLDEQYVRTFIKFKDGHEIDQKYDVKVPEDPVMNPVQICVTVEQFNRFYINVKPIMSTGIVAKYDKKLYEGDTFDMSHVKWFLSYKDGYMKEIDGIKATVDSNTVGKTVKLTVESDYYNGTVELKAIPITSLSAIYDKKDVLYDGDKLEPEHIVTTVVWDDKTTRVLEPTEITITNNRVFANQFFVVSTVFGDVNLDLSVVGVKSVTMLNAKSSYIEGDILQPTGFHFIYDDGSERNVDVSKVVLSNQWQSPLSVGINEYTFTYHGVIYTCSVNAAVDKTKIVPTEQPIELPTEHQSDGEHDTQEQSDDGDDIIVVPGDSDTSDDIKVESETDNKSDDDSDEIVQIPVLP